MIYKAFALQEFSVLTFMHVTTSGNATKVSLANVQRIRDIYLFIYLGFYIVFNTVQVISRRVVGRAEETSTYSSLGFCIVNCRPTASNYHLSHLRPCRESNSCLRGARRERCHSATVAPRIRDKAKGNDVINVY